MAYVTYSGKKLHITNATNEAWNLMVYGEAFALSRYFGFGNATGDNAIDIILPNGDVEGEVSGHIRLQTNGIIGSTSQEIFICNENFRTAQEILEFTKKDQVRNTIVLSKSDWGISNLNIKLVNDNGKTSDIDIKSSKKDSNGTYYEITTDFITISKKNANELEVKSNTNDLFKIVFNLITVNGQTTDVFVQLTDDDCGIYATYVDNDENIMYIAPELDNNDFEFILY